MHIDFEHMTTEEMLRDFLCYFKERQKVESHAIFFTEKGVIEPDQSMWASFTIFNQGDEDITLYGGNKLFKVGDGPISYGPYFNEAKRMDFIEFEFAGGGLDPRLELVFDQYSK